MTALSPRYIAAEDARRGQDVKRLRDLLERFAQLQAELETGMRACNAWAARNAMKELCVELICFRVDHVIPALTVAVDDIESEMDDE